MRGLWIAPMAIALTAGLGWGLCRAAGWQAHPREMAAAAVAALIASSAGLAPAVMFRRSSQATIMQAALGGTVLHMIATLALGGVCYATKLAGGLVPLAVWVSAFYWVTLLAIVVVLVGMIRATCRVR